MFKFSLKSGLVKVFLVLCLIVSFSIIFIKSKTEVNKANLEKTKYVPDAKTAIDIAKTIWIPTYGKRVLDEKPFSATLQNDSVWLVTGTLDAKDSATAYAEIQKKDGKILKIVHRK